MNKLLSIFIHFLQKIFMYSDDTETCKAIKDMKVHYKNVVCGSYDSNKLFDFTRFLNNKGLTLKQLNISKRSIIRQMKIAVKKELVCGDAYVHSHSLQWQNTYPNVFK